MGLLVWMNWNIGSRMSLQEHVDFGGDVELEFESEAVVGALEPIQKSDAVAVLPTWKQTMNQEKLTRGLRTPVKQHSSNTSVTRNLPKPDLAKVAGRARCFDCREVGHSSRNCPKKRAQASGGDSGVRTVACDLQPTATVDVLTAHESLWEKLVREERWKRFLLEQKAADEGDHSDAEFLGV